MSPFTEAELDGGELFLTRIPAGRESLPHH